VGRHFLLIGSPRLLQKRRVLFAKLTIKYLGQACVFAKRAGKFRERSSAPSHSKPVPETTQLPHSTCAISFIEFAIIEVILAPRDFARKISR
jgi:hypothetical protein